MQALCTAHVYFGCTIRTFLGSAVHVLSTLSPLVASQGLLLPYSTNMLHFWPEFYGGSTVKCRNKCSKDDNNSTEKKRCAQVSCWVGFLEMLNSGFLEKIAVWEQLILRRKRGKNFQTRCQKLDHGHTQAVK